VESLRDTAETEKGNYCLLRAEILLSISDLGVRYLFRSGLTSPFCSCGVRTEKLESVALRLSPYISVG
jgi:hypothetical protein